MKRTPVARFLTRFRKMLWSGQTTIRDIVNGYPIVSFSTVSFSKISAEELIFVILEVLRVDSLSVHNFPDYPQVRGKIFRVDIILADGVISVCEVNIHEMADIHASSCTVWTVMRDGDVLYAQCIIEPDPQELGALWYWFGRT